MKTETEWDSQKLAIKAVLYGGYARDSEKASALYGFWCALYLELLARAALSNIHPVLLADPQDGMNILYVFGVPIKKGEPTSVPAKTVYSRCLALIESFDEKAVQHCSFMARARNSEIHSGDAAFEAMIHNRWVPEHYRVTKILCEALNLNLSCFFDTKEATVLEEVLASSTKELEGTTLGKVRSHRSWFDGLPIQEREDLREGSAEKARTLSGRSAHSSEHQCPACASIGMILGERELGRKVKLMDDELIEILTVTSSRFICGACRLDLNREELIVAGLPATFTQERWIDPVDHFKVDPRDYLDVDDLNSSQINEIMQKHGLFHNEPDYGND